MIGSGKKYIVLSQFDSQISFEGQNIKSLVEVDLRMM